MPILLDKYEYNQWKMNHKAISMSYLWAVDRMGVIARRRRLLRRSLPCCNLRDLASNLGVGRPLARITGWAKKVGSIKVF